MQKKGLGYNSELPSTDPYDLALTQLSLLDLTIETACYQFGRVMRKCFSHYLEALNFSGVPATQNISFAVKQALSPLHMDALRNWLIAMGKQVRGARP